MAAFLVVANRGYLHPFDTALGQLVLLASGGCFACAFAWLARLMRDRDTARILAECRHRRRRPAEWRCAVMTGWVLLAGLGTGLGLWLIVVGWFPRPPRLDKALDPRGRGPRRRPTPAEPRGVGRALGAPGRRLACSASACPPPEPAETWPRVDKPIEVHLAEQATAGRVRAAPGPGHSQPC